MTTEQYVLTRTQCRRCDYSLERRGAEAGFPPVGWSHVNVTVRHEGSGWTNNTHRVDAYFCEQCTNAICAATRGETDEADAQTVGGTG